MVAPTLLDYQCKSLSFEYGKEIGERERRKGMEYLVYWVMITMEFSTKIKILSIISVETSVPIEKPLQEKLRED